MSSIFLGLLLLLIPPASEAETPSDAMLAVFEGGEVRLSDIEREIRYLSQDETRFREHTGMSEGQKWLDWMRREALRATAERLTREAGFDREPAVRKQARQSGREWLLPEWRKTCYGKPHSPPDEAALARQLGEPRTLPERRRVSHLFRRAEGTEEVTAARRELAALREKLEDKAAFQKAARELSDSQTARRDGRLGVIRPDMLPAQVEEALFSLGEGQISGPVEARGGVHLFFIEKILPPQEVSQERRLKRLRAEREQEIRDACRAQALAEARARFEVEASPDQLRVGSVEVRGPQLTALPKKPDQSPEDIRRAWVEDELLYQLAMASEWIDQESRRERLDDLTRDVLLATLADRQVAARVKAPGRDELAEIYATAERKPRKRRELRLRVLRAPLPDEGDPLAFLTALEQIAQRLRAEDLAWAEAPKRLPGKAAFQAWPRLDTLAVASRLGPQVFEAIKELEPGSVSEPIQDGELFFVVAVDEDVPARDMTLEEALPRLERQERRRREEALRQTLVVELLEKARFELTPEGHERASQASTAEPATEHEPPS